MLTREKHGYLPGTMDLEYLGQDIEALDARLSDAQAQCDDLLRTSEECEAEARRLGIQDVIASVLIQRSRILLAAGRNAAALAALTTADQALGALGQHDLRVGIYAGLAEAHAGLGDWASALRVCAKGVRLVEPQRYNVSGQYLQSGYLQSRIGLYTRGVRAAYETGQYRQMLEFAELAKCRSVLHRRPDAATASADEAETEAEFRQVCERIDAAHRRSADEATLAPLLAKRRTLWDLLLIERAESGAARRLPEVDLAAIQASLDPDEAVLYYFWIDRHTLLSVLLDPQQFVSQLCSLTPEDRAALERFCQDLLERLTPEMPGFLDYLDRLDDFARLLLPPELTRRLTGARRLLISPHRQLHALPFHALPWDGQHRHLIQRFAVTYVPNLRSLLLRYTPSAPPSLLALGIADNPIGALRPLPDAEIEVRELQRLYSGSGGARVLLCGPAANEAAVRQLERSGTLGTFTRLHIATHGNNVNSDTPMESRLFLYGSPLEGLEIANWRLEAELVVLSACCSGQRAIGGRGMAELPGDDLFGLQAAFFAAGARRVLGSLWPVDSEAARAIMLGFHRGLVAGQAPETALQSAVVEYVDTEPNSFFWAPFFLSAVGRPAAQRNERTT